MFDDIEDIFTEASPNTVLAEGIESFVEWPDFLDSGNLALEIDETWSPFGWSIGWRKCFLIIFKV